MPEQVSNEALFQKLQNSRDKSAASLVRRLRIRFGTWEKACEWLNSPNTYLQGKTPAEFVMKEEFSQAIDALEAVSLSNSPA